MNVLPKNGLELQQNENLDFDLLYQTFAGQLRQMLTQKLTGDSLTAEDLVHDTFLKVSQKLHLYDQNKGSMSSWLHTIAANTMRDHWDRLRLHRKKRDELENDPQGWPWPASPYDQINEASIDIQSLLSALTHNERVHFDLILKGCTLQQIALLTGLALGTIKRRHKLVREKIRQQLTGDVLQVNYAVSGKLRIARYRKKGRTRASLGSC